MRVTNNIIMGNTKTNINTNKVNVDHYNTQMTTQKKIGKPSENPIIAIRSLRLSTAMTHIGQYVDNNIPDADAWMDVTYTALDNIKELLTDIRTQCVKGATDTLTADDRKTIRGSLEALQEQVYAEENADYAGRTVFTGYRTSERVNFSQEEPDTRYTITERFTCEDLQTHRYYAGTVAVPTIADINADRECDVVLSKTLCSRVRLAYGKISANPAEVKISLRDRAGIPVENIDQQMYASMEEWTKSADYPLDANADKMIVIASTGEVLFSDKLAEHAGDGKYTVSVTYDKTGFKEGELRPEYFFDCTKAKVDQNGAVVGEPEDYELQDQQINYTVANGTRIQINTQAREVFSGDIGRDIAEMLEAVNMATNAGDTVKKVKEMMASERYKDEESQTTLKTYLDAAQKEADYANDNLQRMYESYIGNFDRYLSRANNAITNLGSQQARLELTKNRVENQQTTLEELKSNNEDRDISDIMIDYYAAYNAYTASLTAAAKAGSQTLLDYL